jgi:AraC-like DNA-binding protein
LSWSGEFIFGESWALYRGRSADNSLHEHAAIQIVYGVPEATVIDADGNNHTGRVLLIRPRVSHALASGEDVTILYVEPLSSLAFELAGLAPNADIATAAEWTFFPLDGHEPLTSLAERITARMALDTRPIDDRLQVALTVLAREPGALLIEDAAALAGLSESRLRALASKQMGLPLSTWLIWRKLERAVRSLSEGASLAAAAATGGFADQAHLARAMRRMFGVTPRTAQRVTKTSG